MDPRLLVSDAELPAACSSASVGLGDVGDDDEVLGLRGEDIRYSARGGGGGRADDDA